MFVTPAFAQGNPLGGDSMWMFKLLCRGGMDGWKLVDDTLWKLQRPAAAEQAQS